MVSSVEILARTNNKVKPTHGNETINQHSLAVVRDKYRTQATHLIRAPLRGTKQIQPLHKKQPLHIQNMNVPSSAMHITDMMNTNGVFKYLKIPMNHIPALLGTHPRGIFPRKIQQYGKYSLQRT